MASIDTVERPALGRPGEVCASCEAALSPDQRYCLNCGARRTEVRVDPTRYLAGLNAQAMAAGPAAVGGDGNGHGNRGAVAPVPLPPAGPGREWTPFMQVAALFALGIMLAVGVLIGKGDDSGASQEPIVVNAQGPVAGATDTAATVSATGTFTSDWPAGTNGWTIEIGSLDKASSTPDQVAAAKADATTKGATEVGALDADEFASLPGGRYVIYSGVYASEKEAQTALKALRASFPAAQVVEVSSAGGAAGAAKNGKGAGADGVAPALAAGTVVEGDEDTVAALTDPDAAQDLVKNPPDQITTGGAVAPPDDKAPGGGDDGMVIK
jgi:hypothetical protein